MLKQMPFIKNFCEDYRQYLTEQLQWKTAFINLYVKVLFKGNPKRNTLYPIISCAYVFILVRMCVHGVHICVCVYVCLHICVLMGH